ncbi:hypothetical protein D3C84_1207270 [compost metagenome]
MTNAAGPIASTLATSVVSSRASCAAENSFTNSSIAFTHAVRGTPAAAATSARRVHVPVAVGNPPTESNDSLSNTT